MPSFSTKETGLSGGSSPPEPATIQKPARSFREGYGKLVAFVERVSGLPPDQVVGFLGRALLIDLITALTSTVDQNPGRNESSRPPNVDR